MTTLFDYYNGKEITTKFNTYAIIDNFQDLRESRVPL